MGGRAGDNGVSLGRRGGERRRRANNKRTHPSRSGHADSAFGDTSFARSKDPCTFFATKLLRRKPKKVARPSGIAVGKTRASGTNRHRDWMVGTMRGSPRVTASAREIA